MKEKSKFNERHIEILRTNNNAVRDLFYTFIIPVCTSCHDVTKDKQSSLYIYIS